MAEEQVEKDVDKEEDKSHRTATDSTSATHPNIISQGSRDPFSVNILLDTGSILPDINHIYQEIIRKIDPLNLNTKSSTNSFCSGLDNRCVANVSNTYISTPFVL